MARINTQDIPPALVQYYKKCLGKTRHITCPGQSHPGLNKYVPKHFPDILEPPHIPTADQLEQRGYFSQSVECFNESPVNERSAYYRLSVNSGLFYYNFYHSENIPRFIAGQTCLQIHRPITTSFLTEDNIPHGYIRLTSLFSSAFDISIDFTTDPAVFHNWFGPPVVHPFALRTRYYSLDTEPPGWNENSYHGWQATERTRITETPSIPQPTALAYEVTFYRSAIAIAPTILWQLYDQQEAFYNQYSHFSLPPEDE